MFEYRSQPTGISAIGCLPIVAPLGVAALFGLLLPSLTLPAALITFVGMWWHRRWQAARPQATPYVDESNLRVLDRRSRQILQVSLNGTRFVR